MKNIKPRSRHPHFKAAANL